MADTALQDATAFATAAQGTKADGALQAANDLSDLNDAATARTNLGLVSLANTGLYANLTIADDEIPIAKLASDEITIAGTSVSLGGSITADAIASQVSADGISGDQVEGGTIAATTITSLTTAGITATGNLDIGSYDFTAQTFTSDVATGTAPFTVASTTAVTNLNADLLDGQQGSYYTDFGNLTIADDEIPIAKLASDEITIAGTSVSLGGSITADAIASQVSADGISGDQVEGGTIAATTITSLTSSNISIASKTITPTGNTGDQTINATAGSVNFASSDTTLTVTNNLVDANSVVILTRGTAVSRLNRNISCCTFFRAIYNYLGRKFWCEKLRSFF